LLRCPPRHLTRSRSEGGIFRCTLTFPADFPNNPPEMRFVSDIWHPNSCVCLAPSCSLARNACLLTRAAVYTDGKVCISILHPPGEDKFNEDEKAEERWRPIIGIETIIKSVQLMLAEPNISSPANVDAAVQYRDDRKGYNRRARACAAKSLE
jgi:ubiquitin-conjugating enzyme E2 G1